MCIGILPAIGIGLSIAGSMMEYAAAQQAADAQNAYYAANAAEAQRAARESYVYQQIRLRQEREAANQKMLENSIEALKKRGTAYNTSGEAGVSGLSVDALIGDIFAQQGRRETAILEQYEANKNDVLSQMEETRARAQARINSVQRASSPSAASYLIKGATGALGAFRGLSIG